MGDFIKAKAPPTRIYSLRVNETRYQRLKRIGERITKLNADRAAFTESMGKGLDKMMDRVEAELDEAERDVGIVNVNVNGSVNKNASIS